MITLVNGTLYYAIEKRITTEDGRFMEHETIVCQGTEIECYRRIKELKQIRESEEGKEDDDPQMLEGGVMIQIEPEYEVVEADKYDEEHGLKAQRSILDRFNAEFGL